MSAASSMVLSAALGVASGLSCWLVIFRIEAFNGVARYVPGAILGAFVCVAGQAVLGWPRLAVAKACGLMLATTFAWRLSQLVQGLGGPLQWLGASLLGAWGTYAGMMAAWPLRSIHRLLLLAMTVTGFVGGLLFTLASALRLYRAGQVWPLVLICVWQGALLTTVGLCLHRARSTLSS